MPSPSLRRRQIAIVALLFAGYASLYFCRADLSVATPLIIEELKGRGLSQKDALWWVGTITSVGTLGYALGKLFLGGLGDYWGGRINFLIGLALAPVQAELPLEPMIGSDPVLETHRFRWLLAPGLPGAPVTYGWSHSKTTATSHPGCSAGMSTDMDVVLVAPELSKFRRYWPVVGAELDRVAKLGDVLS